jgi:hypothetical protein
LCFWGKRCEKKGKKKKKKKKKERIYLKEINENLWSFYLCKRNFRERSIESSKTPSAVILAPQVRELSSVSHILIITGTIAINMIFYQVRL